VSEQQVEREQRVTPLELFFDLVFVFGFFGPLLVGVRGWRVQPAHFVERHGLIVIIAIG
jgi:low temperature requirement protein LtrA